MLDYTRSSYYYPRHEAAEPELEAALRERAGQWPTYGYRRLTAELHRADWPVNSKRVRRIMKRLGIQGQKAEKKRRTTNSDHPFPRYPNLLGAENVLADFHPVMAADDFAYFSNARPGAMVLIGIGNPQQGITYPHHHPRFDIDEDSLPVGAALIAAVARRYLTSS